MDLVLEVCTLDELGYKLAPTQAELTFTQKYFLFYAYPKYHDFLKKRAEDKHDTSTNEELTFKERYKRQLEEKRRNYDERYGGNP